ncbi:GDP-L-fucose synthase [Campylobacter volucris]|uniref:GDP-L-fucose synthase family protein n=1 Tax=Campylobacter volucris TaxID=1031542 RepID=UPI00189E87B0|nr:GDP-L-fucose synthase [Campylobacter volucris]MBF7049542.1 GDP-L-fucose synthase [Campylobacter volucris]MBF7059439.1 GDP-L-fucose synthase [Campylobacter volucris]
MDRNSKIYIAGHNGTAGSAILNKLKDLGYSNLIYKTHKELDLVNQQAVFDFFEKEQPEYVFLCAAKLSPLGMNLKAEVMHDNLAIQNNIIHCSYLFKVKKLINFASSWMYPQDAVNPILENSVLTSELEYNAEPYAIAKIAGVRMCEAYNLQFNTNFISIALTNLYGQTGEFDLKKARVLPAMLRKMHLAKLLNKKDYNSILKDLNMNDINKAKQYLNENGIFDNYIELWGAGNTRREFLHSDDLADACIYIMNNVNFDDLYDNNEKNIKNTHVNIGTGKDLSIKDLAYMIKDIISYNGEIRFDITKPDSPMNRLLDCSKIHSLGWKHKIELEDGIKMMYDWYLSQENIRS